MEIPRSWKGYSGACIMMRNRNLTYKLWFNNQKLKLATFIEERGLSSIIDLSSIEIMSIPEQLKVLGGFIEQTKYAKPKISRIFVGDKEASISFFDSILENLCKEMKYYVLIGPLSEIDFEGEILPTSNLPLLTMSRDLTIACWEKYSSCMSNDDLSIYIISDKFKFAATVDCCTGFYADGGDPDRVVYEISCFDFLTNWTMGTEQA
jgi:hypothetical protein